MAACTPKAVYNNGVLQTRYTYDKANRLTNTTRYYPNGTVLDTWPIIYTPAGFIQTASLPYSGTPAALVFDFKYDSQNRVTSYSRTVTGGQPVVVQFGYGSKQLPLLPTWSQMNGDFNISYIYTLGPLAFLDTREAYFNDSILVHREFTYYRYNFEYLSVASMILEVEMEKDQAPRNFQTNIFDQRVCITYTLSPYISS